MPVCKEQNDRKDGQSIKDIGTGEYISRCLSQPDIEIYLPPFMCFGVSSSPQRKVGHTIDGSNLGYRSQQQNGRSLPDPITKIIKLAKFTHLSNAGQFLLSFLSSPSIA